MLNSPIDEIKSRLNVIDVVQSYIKLKKTGANYSAVCPFHSEKKPSFFVSPVRQMWHCFGCGAGGSIFDFVMKIEGVEFGDALRILARRAGVELKKEDPQLKSERQRLYEICENACRFFERQLEESALGKEAKGYLLSRGMREETVKKWRLGYSPGVWRGLSDFLVSRGYTREETAKAGLVLKSEKGGDYYDRFRARIIFPVLDFNSQVVGFGGRVFKQTKRADGQEEAKYINTPATLLYDKGRILYGLNKAGVEIRKKDACVLVEGYVDAIMANQAGSENTVATSGTALTGYQLQLLRRYSENLFTAFDMDIAGDSATKRGIELAQSLGFNIRVVLMPGEKDPADVVSKDPSAWEELIKNAKTIHDFYFDNALSRFDKNTLEGKKGISRVLLPVIKKIPNKIEQTLWAQSLSNVLDVKEEDVFEELKKLKNETQDNAFIDNSQNSAKMTENLPKPRKDMLEEYLAVLALKAPQKIDLLKEDDFKILSPRFAEIMGHIKNNSQKVEDGCPKELSDYLNCLFLKSEIISQDASLNIEKEFECCLKEVRTLGLKNRLDQISQEMRKAEGEKDLSKIQKLAEEFNFYSRIRQETESV